jgi:hypothetical protein
VNQQKEDILGDAGSSLRCRIFMVDVISASKRLVSSLACQCICAVVAAELTAANCMHGSPQAKADQQQLLGALRELGREFSALVCVLLPITMFIALARPRLRTVVLCIVGALTSARAFFD